MSLARIPSFKWSSYFNFVAETYDVEILDFEFTRKNLQESGSERNSYSHGVRCNVKAGKRILPVTILPDSRLGLSIDFSSISCSGQ